MITILHIPCAGQNILSISNVMSIGYMYMYKVSKRLDSSEFLSLMEQESHFKICLEKKAKGCVMLKASVHLLMTFVFVTEAYAFISVLLFYCILFIFCLFVSCII